MHWSGHRHKPGWAHVFEVALYVKMNFNNNAFATMYLLLILKTNLFILNEQLVMFENYNTALQFLRHLANH